MFRSKRSALSKRLWKLRVSHEAQGQAQGHSDEHEWKSITQSFLKRLTENQLESLVYSVESQSGENTPCIIVSGTVNLGKRSLYSHYLCCRIFRWPELTTDKELKTLPECRGLTIDGAVCCNPFHWSILLRFDEPEIPTESSSIHRHRSGQSRSSRRRRSQTTEDGSYFVDSDYRTMTDPSATVDQCSADIDHSTWCNIAYWELRERVGRLFPVKQPSVRVFQQLPRGDGMCLRLFQQEPQNETIRRTREKIGFGVILSRENISQNSLENGVLTKSAVSHSSYLDSNSASNLKMSKQSEIGLNSSETFDKLPECFSSVSHDKINDSKKGDFSLNKKLTNSCKELLGKVKPFSKPEDRHMTRDSLSISLNGLLGRNADESKNTFENENISHICVSNQNITGSTSPSSNRNFSTDHTHGKIYSGNIDLQNSKSTLKCDEGITTLRPNNVEISGQTNELGIENCDSHSLQSIKKMAPNFSELENNKNSSSKNSNLIGCDFGCKNSYENIIDIVDVYSKNKSDKTFRKDSEANFLHQSCDFSNSVVATTCSVNSVDNNCVNSDNNQNCISKSELDIHSVDASYLSDKLVSLVDLESLSKENQTKEHFKPDTNGPLNDLVGLPKLRTTQSMNNKDKVNNLDYGNTGILLDKPSFVSPLIEKQNGTVSCGNSENDKICDKTKLFNHDQIYSEMSTDLKELNKSSLNKLAAVERSERDDNKLQILPENQGNTGFDLDSRKQYNKTEIASKDVVSSNIDKNAFHLFSSNSDTCTQDIQNTVNKFLHSKHDNHNNNKNPKHENIKDLKPKNKKSENYKISDSTHEKRHIIKNKVNFSSQNVGNIEKGVSSTTTTTQTAFSTSSNAQVYIYNTSSYPIFINSPTLEKPWTLKPSVKKIPSGYCTKLFDYKRAELLEASQTKKVILNDGPYDLWSVRVSLAKGWGPNYSRQFITACPCWLEVLLGVSRPKSKLLIM